MGLRRRKEDTAAAANAPLLASFFSLARPPLLFFDDRIYGIDLDKLVIVLPKEVVAASNRLNERWTQHSGGFPTLTSRIDVTVWFVKQCGSDNGFGLTRLCART